MACSVLEHVHNLCTCSTGGRNIIEQIHVRDNLVNLLIVHSVSKQLCPRQICAASPGDYYLVTTIDNDFLNNP